MSGLAAHATTIGDEFNIPLSRFLRRITELFGEEAAVLWDAAGIALDSDFRRRSRHNGARIDWGIDIVGFSSVFDRVRVVQYRGRMVAAWMGDRWLVRENPFTLDDVDSDRTFVEFRRAVLGYGTHSFFTAVTCGCGEPPTHTHYGTHCCGGSMCCNKANE